MRLRFRLFIHSVLCKLGFKKDTIYYIGGSAPLPPPLSKEEQEFLQKLAK